MDVLLSMGFSEMEIRDALSRSAGNLEAALEILLNPVPQPSNTAPNTVFNFPNNTNTLTYDDTVVVLNVSQYSFSDIGASACTVIASSIMQHLLVQFDRMNNESASSDIFQMTQIVTQGVNIFRTTTFGRSVEHLAVDELGPRFFIDVHNLEAGFYQGLLSNSSAFHEMIRCAKVAADPTKHIGIIITKPPETVAIIIPPELHGREGKYYFFDSHSRPQDGFQNAYLIASNKEDSIIRKLKQIFPVIDLGMSDDYMSMMYNMFEASAFQLK